MGILFRDPATKKKKPRKIPKVKDMPRWLDDKVVAMGMLIRLQLEIFEKKFNLEEKRKQGKWYAKSFGDWFNK